MSSRGAFASEFCQSISRTPRTLREWSAGRRQSLGATPRGRMLPLARASGVARATERSACANRLLRARGASRRSTAALAGAAGRRPPPLRTALAPSVGRHRSTPPDGRDFAYVTESGTNVKRKVPYWATCGSSPSPGGGRQGEDGASWSPPCARREVCRKAGCGKPARPVCLAGKGNGALPHGPSHRALPRLYN